MGATESNTVLLIWDRTVRKAAAMLQHGKRRTMQQGHNDVAVAAGLTAAAQQVKTLE